MDVFNNQFNRWLLVFGLNLETLGSTKSLPMTDLKLNVDLLPEKHTEFMQSWQSFIEHIRNKEGLEGFQLNQSDLHCEIILSWKDREDLDAFLKDRWFSFLKGALNVLGNTNTLVIK